mgnify:FL=1
MRKFYADVILNKEELKESDSNRIELEYYKIAKNVKKDQRTYGIEIVKTEYFNNKKLKESENIYNVTNNEDVINNLLSILKENQVTPIGLNDVVDEIL